MGLTRDPGARPSAAVPIHANVDSLVLRGFASVDVQRVQAAFTAELDVQLRRAGRTMTSWTSQALDTVPSRLVRLGHTANDEALGREIARAVFRAIAPRHDDAR